MTASQSGCVLAFWAIRSIECLITRDQSAAHFDAAVLESDMMLAGFVSEIPARFALAFGNLPWLTVPDLTSFRRWDAPPQFIEKFSRNTV
jgi:hypothetical protein